MFLKFLKNNNNNNTDDDDDDDDTRPIKIQCPFIVCDAIWIHYVKAHAYDLARKHFGDHHVTFVLYWSRDFKLPEKQNKKQYVSCHFILITF